MEPQRKRLNRRGLLGAAGGVAALGAAGAGAAALAGGPDGPAPEAAPATTVPFHGAHQAGITGDAPSRTVLLSLDLGEEVDADRFAAVMRLLTDDAARLTQGEAALADADPELAAEPALLTVTFGFGLGLLERLGLPAPPGAGPLPAFSVDRLEEAWSGGDLLVQVCGEGDLAVSHAIRMLVKDSRSFATVRWAQRGFRQRPAGGGTPRNVLGQVDGTSNPDPSTGDGGEAVWLGEDAGPLAGGTVMVVRRMRTDLDEWDKLDAVGKDRVIGRRVSDGAPLTGEREDDPVDLEAREDSGLPVIPAGAHVRRAIDAGTTILRRSYNYDDGPGPAGESDTGLVFVSYQADIGQFIAIQERLAESDLLNDYAVPIGSAVFVLPPGCDEDGWIGQGLFD
ncbi:Dyp-type peroxidase [Glycomyces sp. A-F 0318]|uniref:Dyp-type peroxidase n=1 Tax=Glycomyces amatae TaxID=2881355 RepID=UPI001E60C63D|nr:Dyp-type peroxidase [Glycomyces amatae]MCD0443680.1 Dyp-type peroxidase [Glycomyces amatae]